ncbi:YiiX family permuted papain-like enzyme [Leptospira sp. GIMC2001]|uniref:YiiX family permuted papain-like enzyme n=1 Tax=Leptospira sp. GIMC2001 TaxID=1513297 RepID=UPI00234907D0|nr:YiiX family permuted papain-like enzyme [Leptospira sp. GIMC2001]WCL50696.1 YiiX family permuted papain-like enzyme [Leptospira sp. GIMC2001]
MKELFKINIIIVFIFFGTEMYSRSIDFSILREGDIIFHESISEQATAIKLATNSRYTHVGIIFKERNIMFVLEAIQPVKKTKLENFIKRGKNNHFVVKRLKDSVKIIDSNSISRMKEYGYKFIGKDYDYTFEWNDNRIYCTELVWKIYKNVLGVDVGELKTLESFDLSSDKVKKIMNKRYGKNIPLNEIVISPEDIFIADNLYTIISNN